MAMRIILKHSSVEDQRPTVEQAGQAGELLLNTNTAGTFLSCKDSAGKIHQVGGIKISTGAPANPVKGTVWLDIALGVDRGLLKVYDGSQWVTGGGTFDACVDGGLVQDPDTGCWSVSLSIDDLTDVDTSTTAPLEGEILIWDGSNWVPKSLADVQLDWSDLPACLNGGLVYDADNDCWSVDWSKLSTGDTLDWDGDKWDVDWSETPWEDLPVCANGGLTYDTIDDCWNVAWSQLPTGDTIDWDGDKWDVDWSELPTDNSLDWDGTNKQWGVDWEQFPGGKFLDYNNSTEAWDVTSIVSQDTAPDYEEDKLWYETDTGNLYVGYDDYWVRVNTPGQDGEPGKDGDPVIISQDTPPPVEEDYIWFNTATGEAFFGYVDPSGDAYWVALSKPGADGTPGKDGDPVVISQDSAPLFQEDAIWFNTATGEAFFGYKDPSGDEYWVALSKPGADGAPGRDGIPVIISQDTAPGVVEDAIWFNTSTGEAFFGYVDPSGDEYWVALSKPGADGAPGKNGDPVIISQDTAPPFQEDAIWFNTATGEAFFGYKDPSGDEYWVALNKPGADGAPWQRRRSLLLSHKTPHRQYKKMPSGLTRRRVKHSLDM